MPAHLRNQASHPSPSLSQPADIFQGPVSYTMYSQSTDLARESTPVYTIIFLRLEGRNYKNLEKELPQENFNVSWIIAFICSRWTQLTSQISGSVCSSRGSMLLRTVPSNKVGSWGIIPNLERRSFTPILRVSKLSIMIRPSDGSTSRNKAWIKVDLPLPVRPTTPTFSPPLIESEIPFKTRGMSGRYRSCIFTPSLQVY